MVFPRSAALIAATAAAVFALVACGGDDDGGASPTGAVTDPATTGPEKIEIPAGALVIDQDNLSFKPDKIEAKVGDKIYLKNSETAIHTVTINGRNVTGNMRRGEVVIWVAEKAGEYKVTCDFHPQMKGTITVR